MKKFHRIIAILFILTVLGLSVYHFVMPDRAYSAGEKRALEQFPELSLNSLTTGRFMERAEDYLADQFPLRSQAMSLKTGTQVLLGKRESQGVYYCGNDRLMEGFEGMDPENYAETMAALKAFAAQYEGPEFYFLMVPNAVWRYPKLLPSGAETQDQDAFLNRFFQDISEVMTPVDIRKEFKSYAPAENLYYRTDHHWTTDGAYEAAKRVYSEIKERDSVVSEEGSAWNYKLPVLGQMPEFTRSIVKNDFVGSLVVESGFPVRSADWISIYFPKEEGSRFLYTVNYGEGSGVSASCYDVSKLDSDNAYEVFFGGNHPLVEIETSLASTRSILIVKDSYANAFIPFLIPEYRHLTIVDPRYYYDNIDFLMTSGGYQEVLFLYNVNTFSEDTSLKTVLQNEQ
ncbi:MAG: hypothetical protein IJL73_05375 [Lachnospiraceae bacterium]|nr:hypothetical protein [Lachnospiraceae bacterium]